MDVADQKLIYSDAVPMVGNSTITIRFENRVQWQKYRKYILKTDWDFDGGSHPYVATLEDRFSSVEDLERITKSIVQLLQLGFDVYSCRWELEDPNKAEAEYVDQNGMVHHEKIDISEPRR